MRKNQTLLVAGILLLASAGVAQAQGVYEVFSNAVKARAGGAREEAGDVVLFLRTGTHATGVITVTFSAPIAEGLDVSAGGIGVSDGSAVVDVKKGTVTITMPSSGENSVTLSGVRLDVREAEAPVTAMFAGDSNAFLSGAANVISSIDDALEVESTTKALLTRGDMGMATVTIKEAFGAAFTTGTGRVHLRISGVPDKATLGIMHVYPTAAEIAAETTPGDAIAAVTDVEGEVTLNEGTANTAEIVTAGAATTTVLSLTSDGDDIDITIDFTAPATTVESLSLVLDLDARSSVEDIMLPLGAGMVQVMAQMAPTKKPTPVATNSEYFAENLIAAEKPSFTFAPASCTLLFPYAVYLPDMNWDTGIAISNPSAFTDTPLSGTLTFTLFPNDGDMIEHQTSAMSTGEGLDADGFIPAGNTHTVRLGEVLADAGMLMDFIGHIYVRTNFTGCRGVGWVTNFSTVNQAYLPYFGDNLDEGDVPANQ